MLSFEKLICFIFVLFIVYFINKQCTIEGNSNIDSFNKCIDDPKWFTTDKDGNKFYCSDIGTSASCYDFNSKQQEGWERCLKSCGNCSKGSVTISRMDNLATYSGDPVEDFGMVLFVEAERHWTQLNDHKQDIQRNSQRNSQRMTTEDGEDIVDLINRLENIEKKSDIIFSPAPDINCTNQSVPVGKLHGNNCTEIDCDFILKKSDTDGADDNIKKNEKFNYIRFNGSSFIFPPVKKSCDDLQQGDDICNNYYLLDHNVELDTGLSIQQQKEFNDFNKEQLKDRIILKHICPEKCGVSTCTQ